MPMIASLFFDLVRHLPIMDWRDLTAEKPFIVLSPHPDDESLGTGGLIALARRHHQDVAVVVLTDGSKSHPNSATYPRERLIATRRSELKAAGHALGVGPDRLIELGLPDASAPLRGPEFDRSVDRIEAVIASIGARSMFVTWEHDPHCDHEAAAYLAKEIRIRHPELKLWSYPVWGWHIPMSQAVSAPTPTGLRLAVSSVLAQKRAAITAHVSQMTNLIDDDPEGFRFTAQMLEPFLGPYEYYIEVPAT